MSTLSMNQKLGHGGRCTWGTAKSPHRIQSPIEKTNAQASLNHKRAANLCLSPDTGNATFPTHWPLPSYPERMQLSQMVVGLENEKIRPKEGTCSVFQPADGKRVRAGWRLRSMRALCTVKCRRER
jgi:hypothetical protein